LLERERRNTGTSVGSQQTSDDNTDRAKSYVTGEKQNEKKREILRNKSTNE